MENLAGPHLLQAFFDHAADEVLGSMDNATKAALRLSCKTAKAFVDGTVTTAGVGVSTLDTILRCDWQLSELYIDGGYQQYEPFTKNDFTSLLYAVCSNFPALQVLEIDVPLDPYDLPANIGQLSKLNTLQIVRRYFTALPASFGQLSSLERLELNAFYEPDSRPLTIEGLAPLKQLTQLKYLVMDGSLVSKPYFPGWLGSFHFPVLEDLRLAGGLLLDLPSSISNFSNLTALCIGDSVISEVPESIGSLQLLKKLVLRRRDMAINLPTSFSKLTSLEHLDVTTDMQSFAAVEHLNKLTRLNFHHQIDEEMMPYPEFLWTFRSLQNLHLWWSAVPSLPDALGNLKNLKVLSLGYNDNLEELPETIQNLTQLTSFTIDHCHRLLKLPESIGNLQLLRELEIHRCGLTTLPESLGDLQHLETLKIVFCESFERLPSSIGNLRALKELVGQNCGKVFLPESFADLVLDKPVEDCSLGMVLIGRGTQLTLDGPRVSRDLNLLQERGVLQ